MTYQLAADMMPLAEAVAVAHRRVFSGTIQLSPDASDVIATALSGHLAIYGARDAKSDLIQLTEFEFSRGAFRGGATRFEFRDGKSSIINLAVRKADLARVLDTLSAPRGDPKLRS